MSDRDVLIRRLYEPAVYHRLVEDLSVLQRAARRLRAIGWFLFAVFTTVVLIGFLVAGPLGLPWILAFSIFSYAWVFLCFLLARHVANGRRPALFVSVLFASAWAFGDVLLILHDLNGSVAWMIVKTLMLIAHLNLIKLLVQGWFISYRLDALADARRPLPAGDEPLLEID